MAETKDSRFSIGWVLGGTVIIFLLSFLASFILTAAKLEGLWPMFAASEACFFIGGLIVGKQSSGSTILEAGLAAVLALVISNLLLHTHFGHDPKVYLVGYGIPFVTALFGGWLGEQWQGGD